MNSVNSGSCKSIAVGADAVARRWRGVSCATDRCLATRYRS
ncbi:hypothetical protein [Lysobacter gummosus]